MKQTIALFYCLLITLSLHATILRVNNNPGVNAPFSNAQQAHNAASTHDTILLESSPDSYGSLYSSKELVWMGAGFFLNQVPLPQWNQNSSKLDYLRQDNGSQHSKFIGIQFISQCDVRATTQFYRCLFDQNANIVLNGSNSSGTEIRSCFFNTLYYAESIRSEGTEYASGIMITNNFFRGSSYTECGWYNQMYGYCNPSWVLANAINLNATYFTGTIIQNNIFAGDGINKKPISIGYGYIKNNIFQNTTGNQSYSNSPAAVTNNIFMNQTDTNYVGNNGNVFVAEDIASSNSVFQGVYSTSSDSWMRLKAGSAAIGAGDGGADCGVFGGSTPYTVQGLPPIPTIGSFQATSAPGNVLPCVISIRSRN